MTIPVHPVHVRAELCVLHEHLAPCPVADYAHGHPYVTVLVAVELPAGTPLGGRVGGRRAPGVAGPGTDRAGVTDSDPLPVRDGPASPGS